MNLRRALFAALLLFLLSLAGRAEADPLPIQATFALIVGSNESVDPDVTALKYADDDAARYFDLFRLLGARTYLLTRPDENTRRLHPQAAAEAMEPRQAQLDRAVNQLASDVAQAASRSVTTVLYVVYAGHGNIKDGQGYVSLEDARVTGIDLARIVQRIPAAHVHVIADACASYFLAHTRGPGGQRRPLAGFRTSGLADDPRVGLLLSTSSARESHEWDAFQSGVFSHAVRSGLYGGADADGDGVVSYTEIAAFVSRASAAVPNEKYRPDVYARAPRTSETLLEIRRGLNRRLVIEGQHAAHYYLEDGRGVRLLDVHNAPGHMLLLVRPAAGRLYLRRLDDDKELLVDPGPEVVATSELSPREPASQGRGAEHEAFKLLFSLPFDPNVVADYREQQHETAQRDAVDRAPPSGPKTSPFAIGAFGVAAAAVGVGTYFTISAATIADNTSASMSNAEVVQRNDRVSSQRTGAIVSFAMGGAAAATGLAVLLWPRAQSVQAAVVPGGGFVGYRTFF